MTIHLIRHAETVFNASRVVQPAETPLSERGRLQAEQLATRLATAGITRILSSDLARAVATAEAIGRSTGATLGLDPDLQERNFGAVRGTPYAELREDIFAAQYVPPGGESWAVFHARVDRVWDRVVKRERLGDGLAIVTHGLVCWSIVSRHLEPGHGEPPMRFGNTGVTVIDGPAPWQVRLLDCTAHLDERTRVEGARA